MLPDSRAHGESGGTLATYGLRESDDIHRWVDWLYGGRQSKCVYGFGESMGAALVLDLHVGLVLRNTSPNHVRGVTLRVVAQEVTLGGKASVAIPSLNVAPGEGCRFDYFLRHQLGCRRRVDEGSRPLLAGTRHSVYERG